MCIITHSHSMSKEEASIVTKEIERIFGRSDLPPQLQGNSRIAEGIETLGLESSRGAPDN